ncbi:MAG: hypothetical protein MUE51_14545 [Thermoleophilia bacterium]|nr:hypothetical protein [Thermoleophilia bacterium]
MPGEQVRFRDEGGWRFGTLIGMEGGHALVRVGRAGERVRVPAAAVRPWPPPRG